MAKVNLQTKIKIEGYSKLFGVHHTRIKARSKTICENSHGRTSDYIREKYGSYTKEYRLVKEDDGFIFREVIQDNGISGHSKTIKSAIVSALYFVDIFIDEPFEHQELPSFKKMEIIHNLRNSGCKHKSVTVHNFEPKAATCNDCQTFIKHYKS